MLESLRPRSISPDPKPSRILSSHKLRGPLGNLPTVGTVLPAGGVGSLTQPARIGAEDGASSNGVSWRSLARNGITDASQLAALRVTNAQAASRPASGSSNPLDTTHGQHLSLAVAEADIRRLFPTAALRALAARAADGSEADRAPQGGSSSGRVASSSSTTPRAPPPSAMPSPTGKSARGQAAVAGSEASSSAAATPAVPPCVWVADETTPAQAAREGTRPGSHNRGGASSGRNIAMRGAEAGARAGSSPRRAGSPSRASSRAGIGVTASGPAALGFGDSPLTGAGAGSGSGDYSYSHAEVERLLQRAFLLRARSMGLADPATQRAQVTLARLYVSQRRMDAAAQLRDAPHAHMAILEARLADFDARAAAAAAATTAAAVLSAAESYGVASGSRSASNRRRAGSGGTGTGGGYGSGTDGEDDDDGAGEASGLGGGTPGRLVTSFGKEAAVLQMEAEGAAELRSNRRAASLRAGGSFAAASMSTPNAPSSLGPQPVSRHDSDGLAQDARSAARGGSGWASTGFGADDAHDDTAGTAFDALDKDDADVGAAGASAVATAAALADVLDVIDTRYPNTSPHAPTQAASRSTVGARLETVSAVSAARSAPGVVDASSLPRDAVNGALRGAGRVGGIVTTGLAAALTAGTASGAGLPTASAAAAALTGLGSHLADGQSEGRTVTGRGWSEPLPPWAVDALQHLRPPLDISAFPTRAQLAVRAVLQDANPAAAAMARRGSSGHATGLRRDTATRLGSPGSRTGGGIGSPHARQRLRGHLTLADLPDSEIRHAVHRDAGAVAQQAAMAPPASTSTVHQHDDRAAAATAALILPVVGAPVDTDALPLSCKFAPLVYGEELRVRYELAFDDSYAAMAALPFIGAAASGMPGAATASAGAAGPAFSAAFQAVSDSELARESKRIVAWIGLFRIIRRAGAAGANTSVRITTGNPVATVASSKQTSSPSRSPGRYGSGSPSLSRSVSLDGSACRGSVDPYRDFTDFRCGALQKGHPESGWDDGTSGGSESPATARAAAPLAASAPVFATDTGNSSGTSSQSSTASELGAEALILDAAAGNVSSCTHPVRSVFVNSSLCMDPLSLRAVQTKMQAQIARGERKLGRLQAAIASAAAAGAQAGATVARLRTSLEEAQQVASQELAAAAVDYEDSDVPAGITEVLDAWLPITVPSPHTQAAAAAASGSSTDPSALPMPPSLSGLLRFPLSSPSRLGAFRVRLFLANTQTSVGFPLTLRVREVMADVTVPAEVICGRGFTAQFRTHFALAGALSGTSQAGGTAAGASGALQRPRRRSMAAILRSRSRAASLRAALVAAAAEIVAREREEEADELASAAAAAAAVGLGGPGIQVGSGSGALGLTGRSMASDGQGAHLTYRGGFSGRLSDADAAAAGRSGNRTTARSRLFRAPSSMSEAKTMSDDRRRRRSSFAAGGDGGSSRIWAGLFVLDASKERWMRVARTLLAPISSFGSGSSFGHQSADGDSELSGNPGPQRAGLSDCDTPLRPPMTPPYDPSVPIESHWLPRSPAGELHFGQTVAPLAGSAATDSRSDSHGKGMNHHDAAAINAAAMVPGHPLYPGVYCVRLFAVAPSQLPTLDGLESPQQTAAAAAARRPGVVVSRCIAVSNRFIARAFSVPAAPPFTVSAPLLRELRIYIGASAVGTSTERDALLRYALPQLQAMAAQRHVAVTVVDLRQRLVVARQAPAQSTAAVQEGLGPARASDTFAESGTGVGSRRVRRRSSIGAASPAGLAGLPGSDVDGSSVRHSYGGGLRRGSNASISMSMASPGNQGGPQSSPTGVPGESLRALSGGQGNSKASQASAARVPVHGYAEADTVRLLATALAEITECRPHGAFLLGGTYGIVPPPGRVPKWFAFAHPWLWHYGSDVVVAAQGLTASWTRGPRLNSHIGHGSAGLLGSPIAGFAPSSVTSAQAASVAGNGQTVFPPQDQTAAAALAPAATTSRHASGRGSITASTPTAGPCTGVSVPASVLDCEMFAALALPRMHVTAPLAQRLRAGWKAAGTSGLSAALAESERAGRRLSSPTGSPVPLVGLAASGNRSSMGISAQVGKTSPISSSGTGGTIMMGKRASASASQAAMTQSAGGSRASVSATFLTELGLAAGAGATSPTDSEEEEDASKTRTITGSRVKAPATAAERLAAFVAALQSDAEPCLQFLPHVNCGSQGPPSPSRQLLAGASARAVTAGSQPTSRAESPLRMPAGGIGAERSGSAGTLTGGATAPSASARGVTWGPTTPLGPGSSATVPLAGSSSSSSPALLHAGKGSPGLLTTNMIMGDGGGSSSARLLSSLSLAPLGPAAAGSSTGSLSLPRTSSSAALSTSRDRNITSAVHAAYGDGAAAIAARLPQLVDPGGQLAAEDARLAQATSEDPDPSRHAVVYGRHANAVATLTATEKWLQEAAGLQERNDEAALAALRAQSGERGDASVHGYRRAAQVVSWFLADAANALEDAFPAVETPAEPDLWTISSAGFAASRSALFAVCGATATTVRRLDEFALAACPRLRPLCIVAPAGAGVSTVIAGWARLFARKSLESTQAVLEDMLLQARVAAVSAAFRRALESRSDARAHSDAGGVATVQQVLARLRSAAIDAGIRRLRGLGSVDAIGVGGSDDTPLAAGSGVAGGLGSAAARAAGSTLQQRAHLLQPLGGYDLTVSASSGGLKLGPQARIGEASSLADATGSQLTRGRGKGGWASGTTDHHDDDLHDDDSDAELGDVSVIVTSSGERVALTSGDVSDIVSCDVDVHLNRLLRQLPADDDQTGPGLLSPLDSASGTFSGSDKAATFRGASSRSQLQVERNGDGWPADGSAWEHPASPTSRSRALGAQFTAMLAFARFGKQATASWQVLSQLPPPRAPAQRLRYANEIGEDVTLLCLHAGEAGCPATGLELLGWLADELVAAAPVYADFSVSAVLEAAQPPATGGSRSHYATQTAASSSAGVDGSGGDTGNNGLLSSLGPPPLPFARVAGFQDEVREAAGRMYGDCVPQLLRRADEAYVARVTAAAAALKDGILRGEGPVMLAAAAHKLLATYVGDRDDLEAAGDSSIPSVTGAVPAGSGLEKPVLRGRSLAGRPDHRHGDADAASLKAPGSRTASRNAAATTAGLDAAGATGGRRDHEEVTNESWPGPGSLNEIAAALLTRRRGGGRDRRVVLVLDGLEHVAANDELAGALHGLRMTPAAAAGASTSGASSAFDAVSGGAGTTVVSASATAPGMGSLPRRARRRSSMMLDPAAVSMMASGLDVPVRGVAAGSGPLAGAAVSGAAPGAARNSASQQHRDGVHWADSANDQQPTLRAGPAGTAVSALEPPPPLWFLPGALPRRVSIIAACHQGSALHRVLKARGWIAEENTSQHHTSAAPAPGRRKDGNAVSRSGSAAAGGSGAAANNPMSSKLSAAGSSLLGRAGGAALAAKPPTGATGAASGLLGHTAKGTSASQQPSSPTNVVGPTGTASDSSRGGRFLETIFVVPQKTAAAAAASAATAAAAASGNWAALSVDLGSDGRLDSRASTRSRPASGSVIGPSGSFALAAKSNGTGPPAPPPHVASIWLAMVQQVLHGRCRTPWDALLSRGLNPLATRPITPSRRRFAAAFSLDGLARATMAGAHSGGPGQLVGGSLMPDSLALSTTRTGMRPLSASSSASLRRNSSREPPPPPPRMSQLWAGAPAASGGSVDRDALALASQASTPTGSRSGSRPPTASTALRTSFVGVRSAATVNGSGAQIEAARAAEARRLQLLRLAQRELDRSERLGVAVYVPTLTAEAREQLLRRAWSTTERGAGAEWGENSGWPLKAVLEQPSPQSIAWVTYAPPQRTCYDVDVPPSVAAGQHTMAASVDARRTFDGAGGPLMRSASASASMCRQNQRRGSVVSVMSSTAPSGGGVVAASGMPDMTTPARRRSSVLEATHAATAAAAAAAGTPLVPLRAARLDGPSKALLSSPGRSKVPAASAAFDTQGDDVDAFGGPGAKQSAARPAAALGEVDEEAHSFGAAVRDAVNAAVASLTSPAQTGAGGRIGTSPIPGLSRGRGGAPPLSHQLSRGGTSSSFFASPSAQSTTGGAGLSATGGAHGAGIGVMLLSPTQMARRRSISGGPVLLGTNRSARGDKPRSGSPPHRPGTSGGSSTYHHSSPSAQAPHAQPLLIPPSGPLEAADRAAVAPQPCDSLLEAVVRILTAEVATDRDASAPGAPGASTGRLDTLGEAVGTARSDTTHGSEGDHDGLLQPFGGRGFGGGGTTSIHGSSSGLDLRAALHRAADTNALLQLPQFLRIAAARVALCFTAEDALSAAARMRRCTSLDEAVRELLAALEAEHPLAIEVLCLLRVSARGLQEQELVDILGGGARPLPPSAHVRPPLLHDRALQSMLGVHTGQANVSRGYRQALATALTHAAAVEQAQLLERAGGRSAAAAAAASASAGGAGGPGDGLLAPDSDSEGPTGAALGRAGGPLPPWALPPAWPLPPRTCPVFNPRAWSDARRALLSCCVVRARGLWNIDGGAIRSAVDRWLLPSRAQRVVYLQHIAAHFWMKPGPAAPDAAASSSSAGTESGTAGGRSGIIGASAAAAVKGTGTRKLEELIPALTALLSAARRMEEESPAGVGAPTASNSVSPVQRGRRGTGVMSAQTTIGASAGSGAARGGSASATGTAEGSAVALSLLPLGLVRGDVLTPAAAEALAALEASQRAAQRVAAMRAAQAARMRGVSGEGNDDAQAGGSHAGAGFGRAGSFAGDGGNAHHDDDADSDSGNSEDRALAQRAAIAAALASSTVEGLRSVATMQAHSLRERRPSYMLLAGWPAPAALPYWSPALAAALLTVCSDTATVFAVARPQAAASLRFSIRLGLLQTLRNGVSIGSALRAAFEARHGICGFNRSPAYHLLRGAVIDPLSNRSALGGDTQAGSTDGAAGDGEATSGNAAGALGGGPTGSSSGIGRSEKLSRKRPGIVVVSEGMFERLRRVGVRELQAMAGVLTDVGQFAAAQAMLESSILLNLAGYTAASEARESIPAAAEGAGSGAGAGSSAVAMPPPSAGPPRIRSLALASPGLQAFVMRLSAAMDRAGRPRGDIAPRDDLVGARFKTPLSPAALNAMRRLSRSPPPPPLRRPGSAHSSSGGVGNGAGGVHLESSHGGPSASGGASSLSLLPDTVAQAGATTRSVETGSVVDGAAVRSPHPYVGATAPSNALPNPVRSSAIAGSAGTSIIARLALEASLAPMVAGYAPWDVPSLSSTDMLGLSFLQGGSAAGGANAPGSSLAGGGMSSRQRSTTRLGSARAALPPNQASQAGAASYGASGGAALILEATATANAIISTTATSHKQAAELFYRSLPPLALEASNGSSSRGSTSGASSPAGTRKAPATGTSSALRAMTASTQDLTLIRARSGPSILAASNVPVGAVLSQRDSLSGAAKSFVRATFAAAAKSDAGQLSGPAPKGSPGPGIGSSRNTRSQAVLLQLSTSAASLGPVHPAALHPRLRDAAGSKLAFTLAGGTSRDGTGALALEALQQSSQGRHGSLSHSGSAPVLATMASCVPRAVANAPHVIEAAGSAPETVESVIARVSAYAERKEARVLALAAAAAASSGAVPPGASGTGHGAAAALVTGGRFRVITAEESVASLSRPVQLDRPYMRTAVAADARNRALLTAVVHNAVQDSDKAMQLVGDSVAAAVADGEAADASASAARLERMGGSAASGHGAASASGRTGPGAAWGGNRATLAPLSAASSRGGSGASSPVRSGAASPVSTSMAAPASVHGHATPGAAGNVDPEVQRREDFRRRGYGPSLAATPHIADVECLAECLGELASIIAERLHAYVDFLQLHIARAVAHAAAAIADLEQQAAEAAAVAAAAASASAGGGGASAATHHPSTGLPAPGPGPAVSRALLARSGTAAGATANALLIAALRRGKPINGAAILAAALGGAALAGAGGTGARGFAGVDAPGMAHGAASRRSGKRHTAKHVRIAGETIAAGTGTATGAGAGRRRVGSGVRSLSPDAASGNRTSTLGLPAGSGSAHGANRARSLSPGPSGLLPQSDSLPAGAAARGALAGTAGSAAASSSLASSRVERRLSIAFPDARRLEQLHANDSVGGASHKMKGGNGRGSVRGSNHTVLHPDDASSAHSAVDAAAAVAEAATAAAAELQAATSSTSGSASRAFDVQPQLLVTKLLALHKVAVQLDRALGPRHPALLRVGEALVQAQELAVELAAMGYHLELEETAALIATRKPPGGTSHTGTLAAGVKRAGTAAGSGEPGADG